MSNTVAQFSAEGRRRAPAQPGLYASDGSRKYLNPAERRRALAAITSLPPDKALFALTLAWTGARVSEVLALTPISFQLENGVVAVTTLKRRRHVVREIPLPPELLDALAQHFDLACRALLSDGATVRLWPWCRTTGWRLVKQVMAGAGIAGRPACPRGLRHGFAIGALQAQVPLNLVQRWLGHARMSTTAIYADASGPEERALAARFWEDG
jgi:integrase